MVDEPEDARRRADQRRRREIFSLSGVGTGFLLAGLGLSVEDLWGIPVSDQILFLGAVAGGAGALAVMTMIRSRVDREGLAARETRRDRTQRLRRMRMVSMPFAGVGVVVLSLMALSRIVAGQGDAGDFIWAAMLPLWAWIVPLMVLGWDREGRRDRKWLDDELTREWRGRALSLGFLVLMGGMSGLYLIGLYRAEWAMLGFPVVLTGAAGVVGLRYAWLDGQAEGGDD
ncbi:MAG: hypothetical protein DCF28_14465 [Alphaproteobacteria bacterium]|nr:MAG: hypothetical protein DCF28_14465 [Alphaproteobacteria bacterium]